MKNMLLLAGLWQPFLVSAAQSPGMLANIWTWGRWFALGIGGVLLSGVLFFVGAFLFLNWIYSRPSPPPKPRKQDRNSW